MELLGQQVTKWDSLFTPITEENPSGENLKYDLIYDQINEARREDDETLPQGIWESDLKQADWNKAIELCTGALENKSKDLQISAWLMEALIVKEGFYGLYQGLSIMLELSKQFWSDVHPQIEDDDYDYRIAPLAWINKNLDFKIRSIAVTAPDAGDLESYSFFQWQEICRLENMKNKGNQSAENSLEETISKEDFLDSQKATNNSFYQSNALILEKSAQITRELEDYFDEECGDDAPSLLGLRKTIDELSLYIQSILKERTLEQPDEIELPLTDSPQPILEKASINKSGELILNNREQAYQALAKAAAYLKEIEPHSPSSYLVERAISWGKMDLSQLLLELLSDGANAQQIFKLLGINQDEN